MAALDEKCDQGLELQIPLARRAIEAYQAGHFEAAQALAVSVCDTYLKQMFPPEPTGKNNKDIRIGYNEMATRLAIQEAQDASVTWALNIGYALVRPFSSSCTGGPETRPSRRPNYHVMSPSTTRARIT